MYSMVDEVIKTSIYYLYIDSLKYQLPKCLYKQKTMDKKRLIKNNGLKETN